MIFLGDNNNTSTVRYSRMRSNTGSFPEKETIGHARKLKKNKPLHLSKRSVSLPNDLSRKTIKTRKLFWFIPKDNRKRRRTRPVTEYPSGDTHNKWCSSASPDAPRLPLHRDIPERVAMEWITTSSTHSLSDSIASGQGEDYGYDDDDLLGLKFVDCMPEVNIKE
jgi:hypothetical protein